MRCVPLILSVQQAQITGSGYKLTDVNKEETTLATLAAKEVQIITVIAVSHSQPMYCTVQEVTNTVGISYEPTTRR